MNFAAAVIAGGVFLSASITGLAGRATGAQAPVSALSGGPIVGVGDSITFGTGTSHPPESSYLVRAAQLLAMRSVDLGIPGALTSRIDTEVSSIPLDASIVVVNAGTNDVTSGSQARVDAAGAAANMRQYEPSFDALIADIRARVPAARLIVVTVRDFGKTRLSEIAPDHLPPALTAATHEWNEHVRSVAGRIGATVLDLEYDAQWYRPEEFAGIGDLHPNDAGAAHLGYALARVVNPVLATPTPAPTPVPTPTPVPPTPVGPAGAPVIVGIGDSITFGTGTSHPPETSFIAKAAEIAGDRYVILGLPAALTSAIATQVPSIPLDAAYVVLYAGTNNVSSAADYLADRDKAISQARYYFPDIDAIIPAIRARVPAAKLIVITVRDFGRTQLAATVPTHFIAGSLTAAAHTWNDRLRSVAAANGVTVLDLETDPQWYDPAEFAGVGDVHPDDQGAAHLARALAPLLRR